MSIRKVKRLLYTGVAGMALLLAMLSPGFADTNVSGVISSNTTWTLSGSPYIVTGNVLVNGGVTLTIQPGVTVKFDSGRSLQIDGILSARGTGINKITFTSHQTLPAPGDWGYIIFSDSSTDATYDGIGNYVNGSILEHVIIEYAGGVNVTNNGALRLDNAHPFINYTTIRNNAASGIYAWNISGNIKVTNSMITNNTAPGTASGISVSGTSGTCTITESSISNNTVTSINNNTYGGGIYASLDHMTISNSTISGNTGGYGSGMYVSGGYADIRGNSINNNSTSFEAAWCLFSCYGYDGGGIVITSADATVSRNVIAKNAAGGTGGGIFFSGGNVTVSENIISENTASNKNSVPFYGAGGGGIRTEASTIFLTRNFIYDNMTQGQGGGAWITGSVGTASNNVISNNEAEITGGGMEVTGGMVNLLNNAILDNTAPNIPAVSYCCSNDQNFRYNAILGNTATGSLPTYTLYLADGSHPLLNNNNIFGNIATYELWNDNVQGSANVNAENNWWGTANSSAMDAKIYDWFDDSTRGIVDYSPYASSIHSDVPISPPTGITATAGDGYISVSWLPNPEPDKAGYKIYLGMNSGNPYGNVTDAGNVTSYNVSVLSTGTYYVTVTAYDTSYNPANDDVSTLVNENQTNGNESWFGKEKTVQIGRVSPAITINPSSHSFGNIAVGNTSTAQTFTISNPGGATLVISSIAMNGGDAAMFNVVTGGSNPCPNLTPAISAGANCTVIVTFSPSTQGAKSTSMRIASNASGSPTLVPLSGTGIVPQYTITATAGPNGSISPSGNVTVIQGANQTFTITPDPGYHVADVKVNISSIGAVTTHTFYGVTSNHTIEASFAMNIITYTINATAGANGIIVPSGTVTVNQGADQLFIITSNSGYHVVDVKVDGASVGAVTSYPFTNVTSNHTIEAAFAPDIVNPCPGATINSGETEIGTISGGSYMNTWTFCGNGGDRVIINAVKTSGTLDTNIVLYPPGGGPAEASVSCPWGACGDQLNHRLLQTGLYTIVIQDAFLSGSGSYNITLLKNPGAVNSPEDPDGGAIASGWTLSGTIDVASDMDAFQFYGAAGDRVIINAVKTSGTLDTNIVLYPPGGGPAEASVSCPWGACGDQLNHQLLQTGIYTIVVQDAFLSRSGTYNITLLKIPGAVNSPEDPDGGAIMCGQSLNGIIDAASDMDAFQFYGAAGDRVIINAVKTSGTLDTNIVLYPQGGGPAEASVSCPWGACGDQLNHQLLQTGLYTIVVQDAFLSGPGAYNISLNMIPCALRPGLNNPSPANGEAVCNLSGTFSWDSVAGATGYDLYFGENVISPLVKIGDNLASPSMPFPPMESGKIYYWYVAAHTGTGDIVGPVWWFETDCISMPPAVSGFSPSTAAVGDQVTITGANFSVIPGNNQVAFNCVPATVISATSTQIMVTVPPGATSGPISVTTANGTATGSTDFTVTSTVRVTSGTRDSLGNVIEGARVEQVDNPCNFTTTDSSGDFSIGMPFDYPFDMKISAPGFRDVYWGYHRLTDDISTSGPFTLWTDTEVLSWGILPGKGVIRGYVVDSSTRQVLSGVVVSASSSLHPATPYLVEYSPDWVNFGGSSTYANGFFIVRNVDASDTVTLTASLSGWTFTEAVFFIHADAVHQRSLRGTAIPDTTPPSPPTGLRIVVGDDSGGTQVRIAWNANAETDLAGYKVYYGTAPRTYGSSIDVGNVTTSTVTDLNPNEAYYIAVTAIDRSGNESGYSKEIIRFADVPADYWACGYIVAINSIGITIGFGDGTYGPGAIVTREQMAAFLVRANVGEPPLDYCGNVDPFTDVPASSSFCKYIKKLVEFNITLGCGVGLYCPLGNLTREQMAAFIVRAVEGEPDPNYCADGSPFEDVPVTSGFCKYIKRLFHLNITQGCEPGKYCPSSNVLRDQMAAFLARAFLGM